MNNKCCRVITTLFWGLGLLIFEGGLSLFAVNAFCDLVDPDDENLRIFLKTVTVSTFIYALLSTRVYALWKYTNKDSQQEIDNEANLTPNKVTRFIKKDMLVSNGIIIPLSSYLGSKSLLNEIDYDFNAITIPISIYVGLSTYASFYVFGYRIAQDNLIPLVEQRLNRNILIKSLIGCTPNTIIKFIATNFFVKNSLNNIINIPNIINYILSALISLTNVPVQFLTSEMQAYKYFSNGNNETRYTQFLSPCQKGILFTHLALGILYMLCNALVNYTSTLDLFQELGTDIAKLSSKIALIIPSFSAVFSDYVFNFEIMKKNMIDRISNRDKTSQKKLLDSVGTFAKKRHNDKEINTSNIIQEQHLRLSINE